MTSAEASASTTLGALSSSVLVALVGGVGAHWSEISLAEYLGVLAAAGGLLGLGHSVHKGAMHISGRGKSEETGS